MKLNNQTTQVMDELWIEQAINGDLDAFNQLVLKHQDVAYNYATTILSDPWQAEDVVQDSFMKAFQKISGFRGGSFRGWLLKIITNSAYDMLRRSKRHPTQPLLPEDKDGEEIESVKWLADPNISVQNTVEQNELTKDIYQAIDDLPEVYRTVLTLVDLHELDYIEAAQVLKIPIGTVKSRLARARIQLKKKLTSRINTKRNMINLNIYAAV